MMQNADMTPSCDISRYSREAWLFLNHLTTTIGVQTIEETALIGESKNISYKDLMQTLVKINAGLIDGEWHIYPTPKSARTICEKMGFSPVIVPAFLSRHRQIGDTPDSQSVTGQKKLKRNSKGSGKYVP